MIATYTKLKSGEWGIRTSSDFNPGDEVQVSRKDGKTRTETVKNRVWKGDGLFIYSIQQHEKQESSTRNLCEECGRALEEMGW